VTRRSKNAFRWLTVLGVVFVWMTLSVSSRVGITFDELGHIVSGYSYWKFDDYRVNAENGVLATRLGALPIVAMDLQFPSRDSPYWKQVNARALGFEFFYDLGNDARKILTRGRLSACVAALLLLLLIERWARGLFGPAAGLIAVTLAAFSPTILAHAGLATSDMILTCCLLAALSAWWLLWHKLTLPRILLATVTAGFAFTAKMSGLLLVPMLVVLLIVRCLRPRPLPVSFGFWQRRLKARVSVVGTLILASALAAAGSWSMIWAAYGFRYSSVPAANTGEFSLEKSWTELLGTASELDRENQIRVDASKPPIAGRNIVSRTIDAARNQQFLPEAFLWGLAQTIRSSEHRPAFLMGKYSSEGWRQFFPLAFLLKSTPPELILFGGGVLALVFAARSNRTRSRSIRRSGLGESSGLWRAVRDTHTLRRRWLYRSAPLLVLFFGYWCVALNTSLNIGHRHLLPIYPVVFIFAGATAVWLRIQRRILFVSGMLSLLAWQIVGAWAARPFYLSYFTPVIGGTTQGWRYLIDSSFDWGQGLPDFADWLAARQRANDPTPVFLTYFGSDSPRVRKMAVTRFGDWRDDHGPRKIPARVTGGWFAISATHFRGVYLDLSGPWSQKYEDEYAKLDRTLRMDPSAAATFTAAQRAELRPEMRRYEVLQFGRLCHYLQNRTPIEVIGASILLFRLTDQEVDFALFAPLEQVNAHLQREAEIIRRAKASR
jgi:4-amino-4-deoxy-L-arabinose transferase-like glycosyltransferase